MGRARFYRAVLRALRASAKPFLIGGSYALAKYTGLERLPRDLDVMVHRRHWPAIARSLRTAGLHARLTFPHWLGKASNGGHHVDIIFNSGNGLTSVDDVWFERAVPAQVLGLHLLLTPAEELIWSKAFVMERERYDGADVQHLFLALADRLDWRHLRERFRGHERVLLTHVLLFGYVYPQHAHRVPAWLTAELLQSPIDQLGPNGAPLCRGTYLSRAQYLPDVRQLGFADARLKPSGGSMTSRECAIWTAPVDEPQPQGGADR